MTEDFALIDFALSVRSPAEIAEAIGRAASAPSGQQGTRSPQAGKGGLVSRMIGHLRGARGIAGRRVRAPLLIQPEGTLGSAPLTRPLATDMGFGASASPVRLSAPIGVGGLTLIEFREGDGETSAFCEALSAELGGDEVFYFRYSGGRHPGAHYAFHVYQDGRATRRAVSVSAEGAAPEATWQGIDSGMPHPAEADSLPAPGTPTFEIMTPVRQANILEALGVDPDALFMESPGELLTLELSDAPGGKPLSSAHAVCEARLGRLFPAAEAPSPARPEAALAAAGADPDADGPGASWEDEVTRLLVQAVEAALPPEQQVAWLNGLTARLEAGEIDSALDDARRMIEAGRRTPAEKRAAATRLAELFGLGDPGGGSH